MRKTIFMALLLWASHLWAADGGTVPVENKKPEMIKSGEHYYLDMKDGRVAGFFRQNGPIVRAPINLRQIENTCDYGQALSNCHIDFDISSFDTSARWVQHPDSTKINQIVRRGVKDMNGDTSNFEEMSYKGDLSWWYFARDDKTYKNSFKRDALVCDNFAWLKNAPVINAQIKIDSWASEFMFQSPETGVNENQSIAQVTNVVLQKVNDKSYEFVAFGPSKTLGTLPPHASTQTASLTFLDKNNKQCQVSFEASLDQIFKHLADPDFKKTDPKTLVEIIDFTGYKNSSLANDIRNITQESVVLE